MLVGDGEDDGDGLVIVGVRGDEVREVESLQVLFLTHEALQRGRPTLR